MIQTSYGDKEGLVVGVDNAAVSLKLYVEREGRAKQGRYSGGNRRVEMREDETRPILISYTFLS